MKHIPTLPARTPWLLPLAAVSLLCACQPKAPMAEVKPVVWVSAAQPAATSAARVFAAVLQPRVESPVGFRVGGRITLRLVETGQRVKAGQTLAQLNTDDLLTGLQSARQQVLGAEAELSQLQADAARLERLITDGSAPAAELERQRTRVRAAQARLDAARQGAQLADNRVNHASLKAPFDGVIVQVMADAGQVLDEGQPMFLIARSGEIEAEVDLPEDLVPLVASTPAQLRVPGLPDLKPLPLSVREVAPKGMGPGRQVRVRYTIKAGTSPTPAGLLRWGQTAEVHWPAAGTSTSGSDGVSVPAGALVKRDGAPHVWVVTGEPGQGQDQRLQAQPVSVQRHSGDAVIVSGLTPGMKVVSAGAQKLVAGTAVIPRERTHTHLALPTAATGAQP
jgi:RND family efflux transporter MFP subunit